MDRTAPVTTSEYRRAVAKIIRDLQSEHKLTDLEFAEKIGCSLGTVRNSRNEESDLGGVYLARIEAVFGPGSIDPYLRLGGSRSVPLDARDCDPLPSTSAAVHVLAVAKSPESDGGERITHRELLAMEPDIDAAIRVLSALKVRCDVARAA
jgi:hypothetical protein